MLTATRWWRGRSATRQGDRAAGGDRAGDPRGGEPPSGTRHASRARRCVEHRCARLLDVGGVRASGRRVDTVALHRLGTRRAARALHRWLRRRPGLHDARPTDRRRLGRRERGEEPCSRLRLGAGVQPDCRGVAAVSGRRPGIGRQPIRGGARDPGTPGRRRRSGDVPGWPGLAPRARGRGGTHFCSTSGWFAPSRSAETGPRRRGSSRRWRGRTSRQGTRHSLGAGSRSRCRRTSTSAAPAEWASRSCVSRPESVDGRPDRAAQIAAAAEVLAQEEGIVVVYSDETPGRELVEQARAALSADELERASELGRRLTLAESLELATG